MYGKRWYLDWIHVFLSLNYRRIRIRYGRRTDGYPFEPCVVTVWKRNQSFYQLSVFVYFSGSLILVFHFYSKWSIHVSCTLTRRPVNGFLKIVSIVIDVVSILSPLFISRHFSAADFHLYGNIFA
jgi:hypothetical protein